MNDPTRRDSMLTIGALLLMSALFGFAVYLPGSRASEKVRGEIEAAEQSIQQIPQRVAELQLLRDKIAKRQSYLKRTSNLIPSDTNVHSVLMHVAGLAESSQLHVTRLEPLTPIDHETYSLIPFQVSFSGPFHGIAAFLKGLVETDRLVTIQQFDLKSNPNDVRQTRQADVHFSVYVRRAEVSGFDEFDTSSHRMNVDTRIR